MGMVNDRGENGASCHMGMFTFKISELWNYVLQNQNSNIISLNSSCEQYNHADQHSDTQG